MNLTRRGINKEETRSDRLHHTLNVQTQQIMVCLEDLPNEIIYRIFDNLSVNTIIVFSCTCKRYLQCRHLYNQYQLSFQSISKSNFDLLCRLIRPSNIISLTLSDDDNATPGQIQAFLKTYPIHQLTRLHCLKLFQIDETHLEDLLKPLQKSPLTSLYIEYRQYFGMLNHSTLTTLCDILSLKTLRTLHLDMRTYQTESIQWPQITQIEYLSLSNSTFHQFVQIIGRSNTFRSIYLRHVSMKDVDNHSIKYLPLKQIESFRIEKSELFFEKIPWLLSFMPKLVHLKLEGFTPKLDQIFTNDRFEEFIQINLPELKTFQFFIRFSPVEFKITNSLVDSLIKQFQRSFWTEQLQCRVICDFIQDSNELHVYSTPCPHHYLKYSEVLSLASTSISSELTYLSERLDFVYELDLNLKDLSKQTKNVRCFPNLRTLKLAISDQYSSSGLEHLSKTIHLGKLNKLILIISSRGDHLGILIKRFLTLLNDLPAVTTLEIFNRWYGISSLVPLEYFCTMIPKNIKHLNVDTSNMNEIPVLIEHLPHVSSFKFKFAFDKVIFLQKILDWLTANRINSTYISDMHYLAIWISRPVRNVQTSKRIKLN
ncbi:unnamed protein product [Adineta ricciae]|uniref:F-box domain-containing protein n=1 Tax=Adineta ricciae TaxID=249248 RepID=A0A815KSM4_ADIRI|nr:unnamed protein product [Adineta ricciae]CAF1399579.1 unnamed protein product [Adineta ricciae]